MKNNTMIYSNRWFLLLCAGFGLFIAAYSVGIYFSTEEGWLELPSGLVVKKHYVFGLCVSKNKGSLSIKQTLSTGIAASFS